MQKLYGKTRDYQVVSEEEKSVSFSFPTVNTCINTDNNSVGTNELCDFIEIPIDQIDEFLPPDATDEDIEEFIMKALEFYFSDENVFKRLVNDAEDSVNIACALTEVLNNNGIQWSRTAKILSERLQKHVVRLKEFAAQ